MKKYLLLTALMLPITACGQPDPKVLRGGEYKTAVDGTEITLNFAADENRAFGKVVNRYNGPYEISGRNIKFGMMASTMMMGLDANAMRVEREYFQFLTKVNTYKISGNKLLLKAADGKEMNFQRLN